MPQSQDSQPLINSRDIQRPLEENYLADAASFMEIAGVEPDRVAQEALGHYWRSRREQIIDSPVEFSSDYVGQRIGAEFDAMPTRIQESDLLASLVADYKKARNGESPQRERSGNAFGLKGRKARRARLESIKEKAGIEGAFSMSEFAEGDEVSFYSEMPPNQGKARALLEGKVIAIQQTEYGPAAVIKVKSERRKGDMEFTDQLHQKGAVVRLIGTVLWNNTYRKDPSTVAQGNVLEFLDKDDKPIVPGQAYRTGERRYIGDSPLQLQLIQVTINGSDIFPPHDWPKRR